MSALEARKSSDQKNRDAYIDRKLDQLERRQERERERKARREGRPLPPPEGPQTAAAFRSGAYKVGEKVRIKDNGMVGEISKVSGKSVTLMIGNISSTVPAERLERISSNEFKAAVKQTPAPAYRAEDPGIQARKLNFRMELDVRGERLSDALDIVTHYIDDALMLSVPSVRIIHGKGTGVLREEIQKYLRTIPGIASVRDEQIQLGGTGVTIVTFD